MAEPETPPAPAPQPAGRRRKYAPRKNVPKGTWKGKTRPHRAKDDPRVAAALQADGSGAAPGEGPGAPANPNAGPPPGSGAGTPRKPPPAAGPGPAPTAPAEDAAERARRDERERAQALARIRTPRGFALCKTVYRAPWALWQRRVRKKGCPVVVVPDDASLNEGAGAVREILEMYPGAWTKALPVLFLAFHAAQDYMRACDRLDEWEAFNRWRAAGSPPAPSTPPPGPERGAILTPPMQPAQGPPPAARPAGLPPEIIAGNGSPPPAAASEGAADAAEG